MKDYFMIDHSTGTTLELYNSTGTVIMNKRIESDNQSIDMSDYKQGLYIVRVINKNGSAKSYKVIKQ